MVRILDKPSAHGIVTNVVPLFAVAFRRTQHVIEKLFLPNKTRSLQLAFDGLAGPFFPKPDEFRQCLCIQLRCAEEVDVIRHYNVTADRSAVAIPCALPFPLQNGSNFCAREDWTSAIGAGGDEVNWICDPNPLKSSKVLMHGPCCSRRR